MKWPRIIPGPILAMRRTDEGYNQKYQLVSTAQASQITTLSALHNKYQADIFQGAAHRAMVGITDDSMASSSIGTQKDEWSNRTYHPSAEITLSDPIVSLELKVRRLNQAFDSLDSFGAKPRRILT